MRQLKKTYFRVVPIALFFGFFGTMNAQKENSGQQEMITDRPDATESPSVVPKDHLQVETGGLYESFGENNIEIERSVYNTTLIRYGLLKNFEIRLGWDFVEENNTINTIKSENALNGFSPLLLGMKVAIAEEKNAMPEIGLVAHLFLPFTASKDFKPGTTGADFRFAFSHTLSEKSNLSYNIGAQWGDDSPEAAYIYSISYGYGLSNKLGAFVEFYGTFPENSSSGHLWDAGLTYLLRPNFQLDASVGSGITTGQDILIGAGLSFRLPN